MLIVDGVEKRFKDKLAVSNLSFTIDDGEILGLLGTNGAGKTTTFRMILGIFKQDAGSITLDGEKVSIEKNKQIGFLPEERSLLPKYTVYDQLCFFGELKGKKISELKPEINNWLEYFGLSQYRDSKIKELSKGNQQKVQFIASVIHKPQLLILDEPFSGLDPFNINLIKEAIKELQKAGTKIIFSSHRLDYIESFAKQVIVLEQGSVVLAGNIDEIKKRGNRYRVEIITPDDLSPILNLPSILNVEQQLEKWVVEVKGYDQIDVLFSVIKDYVIRGFTVSLPTLEQLVVKAFGGHHE